MHTAIDSAAVRVCQLTPANDVGEKPHAPLEYRPDTALAVIVRRTIRDIVIDVAARRGNVTPREIVSPSREHRIAHARQEVMWEARMLLKADGTQKYSWPQIGREIGRLGDRDPLDHTTIMYGFKKHAARRREKMLAEVQFTNEAIAAQVNGGWH